MRCLLWTMLALPAHAASIRGSESALSNSESASIRGSESALSNSESATKGPWTSEPGIGSMFISAHLDRALSTEGGPEGAPCCMPNGWNGVEVKMQCSPQGFGRETKQLSQQACNQNNGYSTYCPTCHCLHDPNFKCGCASGEKLNVDFECTTPGSNPNLVGGRKVCTCIR